MDLPASASGRAPAGPEGTAPAKPGRRTARELLRAWFIASRPQVKPVTIIPVLVGLLLAAEDGAFDPWLAVLTMIGSLLIHAGTDLSNDYYDYVMYRGDAPFTGGSGVIQAGLLSPENRVGIELSAVVDRREFGLDWQEELPTGGITLGYDVTLEAVLEFVEEE